MKQIVARDASNHRNYRVPKLSLTIDKVHYNNNIKIMDKFDQISVFFSSLLLQNKTGMLLYN